MRKLTNVSKNGGVDFLGEIDGRHKSISHVRGRTTPHGEIKIDMYHTCPNYPLLLYPLLLLRASPYLAKKNGIHAPRMLKQPSNVQAHWGPSLRNIWTAKRGKVPPSTYRNMAFEAMALALYSGPYVSVIYIMHAMKISILPMPKKASAMVGTIQCTR